MSLVSTSWRLHAKISRIWANIHPLFVTCIPPTQWISHTHPSMLTWDIWGGREKSISYFSLLLIGITLPSVKSLCSHCEEKTYDIFLRMLEAQMKPGSLWHQSRQFRATRNSIQVTGPEATTNDVIVSFTLHRQADHRESTWTTPEWARCCT